MVSNAYPPYTTGGYEIACFDNVQQLRKKGHEVHILTSIYRRKENHPLDTDKQVYRKLMLEANFYQFKPFFLLRYNPLRQHLARIKDSVIFKYYLYKIDPDIILFWNMGLISFALIAIAEKCKSTAYYISDCWLAYHPWYVIFKNISSPTIPLSKYWWERFFKKILPLKIYLVTPKNVIFCSQALQKIYLDIGYPYENGKIIYHGIDPSLFYSTSAIPITRQRENYRLLYCGRLTQYKGIETLINALNILINQRYRKGIQLTIVGKSEDPAYPNILHNKVRKLSLSQYLQWIPGVDREKIRDIYWKHDILIFPSIWAEPFSITLLEAMASGIPIIGTLSGGSKEILVDGFNSLIFQEDNADQLADKIEYLIKETGLREKLRENSLQTVRQYTLETMSDKIEKYLMEIVERDK